MLPGTRCPCHCSACCTPAALSIPGGGCVGGRGHRQRPPPPSCRCPYFGNQPAAKTTPGAATPPPSPSKRRRRGALTSAHARPGGFPCTAENGEEANPRRGREAFCGRRAQKVWREKAKKIPPPGQSRRSCLPPRRRPLWINGAAGPGEDELSTGVVEKLPACSAHPALAPSPGALSRCGGGGSSLGQCTCVCTRGGSASPGSGERHTPRLRSPPTSHSPPPAAADRRSAPARAPGRTAPAPPPSWWAAGRVSHDAEGASLRLLLPPRPGHWEGWGLEGRRSSGRGIAAQPLFLAPNSTRGASPWTRETLGSIDCL
nr:serine/arginine repetitive matrix protein 1-like [Chrysemys picta bellii]